MGVPVLSSPATSEAAPGTFPADLVHSTLVRTPGGGMFAGGWVDDIPQSEAIRPETGAGPRQTEGE